MTEDELVAALEQALDRQMVARIMGGKMVNDRVLERLVPPVLQWVQSVNQELQDELDREMEDDTDDHDSGGGGGGGGSESDPVPSSSNNASQAPPTKPTTVNPHEFDPGPASAQRLKDARATRNQGLADSTFEGDATKRSDPKPP